MRLIIFVAVVLAIYSAMHLMVWLGVRPLLAGRHNLALPLGLWTALMIVAPVLTRILERMGWEGVARPLAWAGNIWMGFLFLAFAAFTLIHAWNLLVWVASHLQPSAASFILHGSKTATTVLLLTLAIGCYGFFEASRLRIEQVSLATAKLPPGMERLRIVQISDLHLGLLLRQAPLKKVTSAIESLSPDLVVATGDVVDAQINHLDGLAEIFQQLDPPLGAFAVVGNHEVYAGLSQSLDFIRRSGFTVLRNEKVVLTDALQVIGVDDPATGRPSDELPLLRGADPRHFILLLKHRPQVREEALGHFDLQLSGHAHRGQIFPFNLLTGLRYPMQKGLYLLGKQSRLYTSRGTGTWGPPMRVLSPPEITLIELRRP